MGPEQAYEIHGRTSAREPRRRRVGVIPRLERLEARRLLSAELTENNAGDWGSFASDGAATIVSNDTVHVKAGATSIHLRTESGFDPGVRYPAANNANWDLTGDNALAFWTYADNRTNDGFQGVQPIIVLKTAGGDITLTPRHIEIPNQGWQHLDVPLAGSAEWIRTAAGSPTLSHVTGLEIHQDTWEYGFDVYYDDLQFGHLATHDGSPTPPGVNPDEIDPKVLVFVYDPIMENKGGLRQHQLYNSQDPIGITNKVVDDLRRQPRTGQLPDRGQWRSLTPTPISRTASGTTMPRMTRR